MLDFSECLNTCDPLHAPKVGLDFTWSNCHHGSKRILCTLDRAVFNMGWLRLYSDWGYKVGARVVSDHSPLIGGCVNIPKPTNVPLRFQKMWLEHTGFMKVVEDSWAETVNGDPAFILLHKLKRLKIILKECNWNTFGNVHVKIKEAEKLVQEKMVISDSNPHDEQALTELVLAQNDLNSKEVQHCIVMKQKSRIKWVTEGSSNTNFFHTNVKIRQTRNMICELEDVDGNMVADQDKITDILVNFFHHKFQYKEVTINDSLLDVIPKLITDQDQVMIESIPELEEIKHVVFSMNADGAPGPDNFSAWCEWLRTLFASAKISVMINGGPQDFFSMDRGLKQGDCLPFYDVCIFSNGSKKILEALITLLKSYQDNSGQIVNKQKSKCFVDGCTPSRRNQISSLMQMELTSFPDKYLGVILKPGRVKSAIVWPMVEMMQSYLAAWKVRKYVTLGWSKVCAPFNEGGLRIRRLEVINKDLLMKMMWKFINSSDYSSSFFASKYKDKYGQWSNQWKLSTVWPGLKWAWKELKSNLRCNVGNGEKISLWLDTWVGDNPLIETMSCIDTIKDKLHMTVGDILENGEWRIPCDLQDFIPASLPTINGEQDKLIWSGDMKESRHYGASPVVLQFQQKHMAMCSKIIIRSHSLTVIEDAKKGVMPWCLQSRWMRAKKEISEIIYEQCYKEINFSAIELAKQDSKLPQGVVVVNKGKPSSLAQVELPGRKYCRFC
ncbi:uncharacterized protein LOC113312375 [Papaver somniferum]|uniref:uncharacterized protein LOC113312375 n=1 Tax=Papaver somniferum TaxID=3469 RepID=UPI000E700D09|nr:uncharacterized protein LOC113312375 [Papaver somniferum]